MKLIPKFYGSIQNGKLSLFDDENYQKYLSNLSGEVVLIVKKKEKERSNQENKYYWSVIVPMVAEEMGITNEQAHLHLKSQFLKLGVDAKNGKRYEVLLSTKDLSTVEFEDYTKNCRQYGDVELNIFIPEPNQVSL